jgi:hypothetical protein
MMKRILNTILTSNTFIFCVSALLAGYLLVSCSGAVIAENEDVSIKPYAENPFYWQYKGKPLFLAGGTWQDNLFNHPVGLEDHLDKLVECGGNYVRNTMSHRNEGNIFAYTSKDGKYNLDQWNDEYWQRFENLLRLCYERDIIVQVEIFDPWDLMMDHQTQGGWSVHPYNPANNINYTTEESGLPVSIQYNPGEKPSDHPFYQSVPARSNNELLLNYQKAFVDTLITIAFKYPNVLYCIQNESGEVLEFGDYWIRYIREQARQANKEIYTTDMRRINDITADDHAFIYDNPSLYTFVDISQNNSQNIATGQLHWDRIQAVRSILQEKGIRPMNNNKIYSREDGEIHVNGPQRFWRIIMGGCASARFHRPHPLEGGPENHYMLSHHGLGLHPQAQANIASARELFNTLNIFTCEPDNGLLAEREENEAYCIAELGKQYAIYFPHQGAVTLNLSDAEGTWILKWLNISDSKWLDQEEELEGGDWVQITSPGIEHCVAVLLPKS